MNLVDILNPDTIRVPLKAQEKRDAIVELTEVLQSAGLIPNAQALAEVVWEREQQRSTGIGEGLAIPHGRVDGLEHLVMAIGRPAEPIDFGAIDMKPVQLVVLLASPTERTADHIQALGRISRIMLDPSRRRRIYAAESADELFGLFRDAAQ